MKRVYSLGILFSIMFTSQIYAGQINDEWTVFSQKKFSCVTGTAKTYTQTFTTLITRSQSFNLKIINGNANGSKRVTNATIKLNGVTVVTPSECNFETSSLTKEVTIKSSNTLQVTVNGATGSFLTIECSKHLFSIQPIVECVENNGNGTYTAHFGYSNSNSFPVTVPVGLLNLFLPLPINRNQPTVFEPGLQQNVITVVFNGRPLIWEVRGRIATATNNPALACSSATDTTCPNLSVTAPINGLITSAASVQVIGTATDASPVTVTINGTAVTVDASGGFSSTVNLAEGSNTITVIATDASGNQTTVTRNITRDSIQPVLTVTAPTDSTIINQANIAVSGTVTDASAITLTVNGSATMVNTDGSFSAQAALTEGVNTVTVSAIDTANNQTSVIRTVIKDTEVPIVNVQTPADNQITNQQIISISGTVTDLTMATLTINGNAVSIGTGGAFNYNLSIVEGLNTITLVATDAIGNQTTVTRTVRRDTETPILVIQTPENNEITNQQIINVSGTVADSTTLTLTVNGINVPINAGGAYSYDLSIVEGQNVITIVATDAAGNESRQTIDVRRDTQSPVITLTSPVDSLITSQQTIGISGTVTDSTKIKLTLNGEELIINTDGTFSLNLPIAEGLNAITVIATDTVGNQMTITRIVRRDTQAPIVNLASPSDSLVTNQQTINVSGTVIDSTAIQLTVNGNPVTIGAGGAFSTQITLTEGINTITIIVTDAAGNQTTIIRTVTRDTESPVITLISPIDSLITNQSNVTVSGTIANPSDMTLTVNGNPTTIETNGTFSTSVGLNEGLNIIILVATDPANNQTTITRTIRRDTQSPVLTITTPIDSLLTNQQILNVSGNISDSSSVSLTINGNTVSIAADGLFNYNISLNEGINNIAITTIDAAGNTADVSRIVMLDTTPPVLTITSPVDGTTTSENTIQVSGTVTDQTDVTLTVNGTAVSVNADGSFNATVSLVAGSNTITITALDAVGQATLVSRTVICEGEVLPPDPATVAPPIDRTVVTTIAAATEFLYTGPNPIQTGVEPGTIDPVRVAVIRGKVLKSDLTALSGVKIAVLDHPEFGQTLSRFDGVFDLAVNGGGYLTIKYEKGGYISAQRKIDAPWSDYAVMDSVILLQRDTVISTIDFSDSIQTARGSVTMDERGERQATLFFEQGTTAKMVLANGDSVALSSITVRATEFTVGENGPTAMPAELPATSGYTYCVDLSVDEAIQANASTVVFSKPVSFYVDNFLGFPIGLPVPTAYYNESSGVWVPVNDGYVIQVVGNTDGIAEIDANGDGNADQPDSLLVLGIDEVERRSIASLYSVGKSLWRVEVLHFSPYDCNYGIIGDGDDPNQDKPEEDPEDDPCKKKGSIIGIQDQTLGEQLPISGTSFSMNYNSARVPGKKDDYTINIPLTSETLPDNLLRVGLEVEIAGRRYSAIYNSPVPNLKHKFVWDGRNSYGQLLQGTQDVSVKINYYYLAYYQKPPYMDNQISFGQVSALSTYIRAWGRDVLKTQKYKTKLGKWNSIFLGLGGWTPDILHSYDVNSATLYQGDGSKRRASTQGRVINTIAGSDDYGFSGDGGPAKEALMDYPMGIAVGKDGSIYFADAYNNRIRKIGTNGIITTVAGNGESEGGGTGASSMSIMSIPSSNLGPGDGSPATEAIVDCPYDVALGLDGSMYIAESFGNRIRRVRPDGIIETIAGTGNYGFSGDNGPAIEAEIAWPTSVAVGPDGSVYFSDTENRRVRKISPDGIINTIFGNGEWGNEGDGGPATDAKFTAYAIAIGPEGSLYAVGYNRIKRVTPDGIVSTVAGTGTIGWDSSEDIPGERGDGGPASEARLVSPSDITISSDGIIYITEDYGNNLRKIDQQGIITRYAGKYDDEVYWDPNTGYIEYGESSGDGGPAANADISTPSGIAVAPDGKVYIADYATKIRVIEPMQPQYSGSEFAIASDDGSELYMFNSSGKHLKTLDALTGVTRFELLYNDSSKLKEILDIDSLKTTIEYDVNGDLAAVVSPYGLKTQFTIDSTGYISAIQNPAGEITRFTCTRDGLMESMRDAKNNPYYFTYDTLGRLIFDQDPEGGFSQLERTEFDNGYEITVTTAEGRRIKYRSEYLSTGGLRSTKTDESGLATIMTVDIDGIITIVSPDGVISKTIPNPDPLYGMQAPAVTTTTTLPSGLVSTIERYRIISQMSGLTVTGMIDSVVVNGCVSKTIWDGEQKKFTKISSEGRQNFSWINDKGRVIKDSIPGIEATTYSYNPQGRLVTVAQGGRTISYTYDTKSFLATVTDPINRTSRFEYDSIGRRTKLVLPDNHEIIYSYDFNGNITTITPPEKPAHSFDYTKVDLANKYIAPIVGMDTTVTRYEYNKDKQILKVIRPDSGVVEMIYDSVGCSTCGSPVSRPKTILFDRGELNLRYSPFNGILDTVISPTNILGYTYDGSLSKSVTLSGEVSGTVSVEYNNNMQATSQRVNGSGTVKFSYDNDGFLIKSDSLSIIRDAETGRISGTTLGNVTTIQIYNTLGEPAGYEANYNGNPVFQTSYQYDSLGRIIQINETVEGRSEKRNYAYDIAGQIWKVWRNDTLISTYAYDANGNRMACLTQTFADSGTYDAQDRMLQYANTQYFYTANGELRKKIEGNDTTYYSYDYFRNLITVQLPNGDRIDYIIDGQNHRIGKKLNGKIIKRWIYSGQSLPVAELDSANNVVSRFLGNYMYKDGNTYQFITDHLGSVRLIIDVNTGTIAQKIDYDEFGNILLNTNPDFQPFVYAGGLYDPQTKLVRFGARDYEARVGRWTVKEPLGFTGSNNFYTYVSNDPINFIDPSGLFKLVFHYHGNWGGPGWAAGKEIAESDLTEADFQKEALDKRDGFYKEHDRCIWKCCNTYRKCPEKVGPCIRNCDHKLASDLRTMMPWDKSFFETDQGYDQVNVWQESVLFDTFIPYILH